MDPKNTEVEFDFDNAGEAISEGLFGDASPEPEDQDVELDVTLPAAETTEEKPKVEQAAPVAKEAPTTEGEKTPESESTETDVPPPKTWRANALAEWDKLPKAVKEEVAKREQEIFRGLETYKADATVGKTVQQILAPYEPALRAAGIDPLTQVQGLMQAHYMLSTAPPGQRYQMFQKIAQEYGVDLSGGEPFVDPQVEALQTKLNELQSKLIGREQLEQSQTRAQLQSQIDAFAADPANVYFDEVSGEIVQLLRAGAARDLREAYDKAIWLNPAIRAKEQARLTAEAASKAQAEAKARAEAARKATAANVRSTPKAASVSAPLGSIDDTLFSALSDIKNRTS